MLVLWYGSTYDDIAGGDPFLAQFFENFQVFKPILLVFMHEKKEVSAYLSLCDVGGVHYTFRPITL